MKFLRLKFTFTKLEEEIFSILSEVGEELQYPTYLVGGFVRDYILSRPCKDIDVVCVGSGIKLAESFASRLTPTPQVVVFKRFGTAMVKYKDFEIEFVGARKESYRSDSRKPTVEEGTLEDDQNRRDFTINALGISLQKASYAQLVDPFNGVQHIEERIIKTPLEPDKTFSDDPLRMMRGIRFASQLQFEIEADTLASIERNKERISIISKERIATEFNKIMLSPFPSVGLNLLEETGLMKIILPEMVALKGVEVRNGKGHKDNFYHTLEVVDNTALLSEDLWLRWAALLHDVGKAPTKRFNSRSGWTFHGHEVVGARMVPKIFKRLKLPLDQKMKYVQKLVLLHLRPISLTKDNITDSAIRRLLFDAGEELDDLMLLCSADITSKNEAKKKRFRSNYEMVAKRLRELEEKDNIRNWQPPITGEMIMKHFDIPPSKLVGLIKDSIREAILDGELANDFDEAFSYMDEKGREIILLNQ